jgi:hypothetical protein
LILVCCLVWQSCFCWGFYAHRKINYYAVFLLPPEMMYLYKPNIGYLSEHAVDPDKRRYAVKEEGPRHYIDLDSYGAGQLKDPPRNWNDAVERFGEDSLQANGIAPWWIQTMLYRLTAAFKEKDVARILKLSAETGHYISDAHVPLHACSNHNGQFTNQKGIHGFWESRLPELLAEKEWDFFIGRALYINDPFLFIWKKVQESAAASDTVLLYEKELSNNFPADRKFAFEDRNGQFIRQYSADYSIAYNKKLQGMVERRMRESVYATASFWYTAWVNAGQPDFKQLSGLVPGPGDLEESEALNLLWKNDKDCE